MKAYRVPRHPEAFSKEPSRRQKRPRQTASAHVAWIRGLPCVISGSRRNVEAAHVRYGSAAYGKRPSGAGEKPDDRFVVPLSADKHRLEVDAQHAGNEREFWARHNIDPLQVAAALWSCSGDDEQAELILREARAASTKEMAR